MANTYTLISSNVLASSAASVTFSSIPATYTDLVLKWSARSSDLGNAIYLKLNTDTGSNYSDTYLLGNGSAASSGNESSATTATLYGQNNRSDYTSNTFSNGELYIPSYTVSQNKPMSLFGGSENNASGAFYSQNASAILWRNTATITGITLSAYTNFVSGSSFYLYGIKNS
jgi:hypothetical protein